MLPAICVYMRRNVPLPQDNSKISYVDVKANVSEIQTLLESGTTVMTTDHSLEEGEWCVTFFGLKFPFWDDGHHAVTAPSATLSATLSTCPLAALQGLFSYSLTAAFSKDAEEFMIPEG